MSRPLPEEPSSTSAQNERFVSAHARAMVVIALLAACVLVDVAGLGVHALGLMRVGPFSQTAADVAALEDEPDFGAVILGLLALAQFAALIATAVAFLVWEHRAYKNLRAFAPKTNLSPGWVVGHWFIPFANLVVPYQSVKEMWVKSDPANDFSAGFARTSEGARPTMLVGLWWFFWIVQNVAAQVYGRLSGGETMTTAAHQAGLASDALDLFAAVLALVVVRTIDRMQTEKGQRLGLSLWAAPPAPPASFDPPPYGSGV